LGTGLPGDGTPYTTHQNCTGRAEKSWPQCTRWIAIPRRDRRSSSRMMSAAFPTGMHSLTLSLKMAEPRGANRSLALGLKVRSCGGALRRAKAKGIRDGQQIEKAAAKGTVRPGQFRGEQEKCLGNCPGVSGSISQEDRGTESAAIGKASRYGSSSLKMRPKVWRAGGEASKTSSRGTIATNESSPSPGTFQLSLGPPRPFF
jgi:hypothetical protein